MQVLPHGCDVDEGNDNESEERASVNFHGMNEHTALQQG
jgi:hypothetical protein